MDARERLADEYKTIKNLLDRLGAEWAVPDHIVCRLAVLSAGEPVVYVSRRVDRSDHRSVAGEVAVLTSNRVIYATFAESPTFRGPFPDMRATATVRVRCWPRRFLRGLALEPDHTQWRNIDADWAEVRTSGEIRSLSVTLDFPDESLTLPLDGTSSEAKAAAHLLALVPSLLDDLERTS